MLKFEKKLPLKLKTQMLGFLRCCGQNLEKIVQVLDEPNIFFSHLAYIHLL